MEMEMEMEMEKRRKGETGRNGGETSSTLAKPRAQVGGLRAERPNI